MTKIINDLYFSEAWTPTVCLRWKTIEINLGNGTAQTRSVLQQKWQCNNGKEEWRDIPVE